jgi:integrase
MRTRGNKPRTYRRGKRWYVDYHDPDGRRHRFTKGWTRQGQAQDYIDREVTPRLKSGTVEELTTAVTFDDLLQLVDGDWRANSKKAQLYLPDGKTEHSGVRRLRAAFGGVEAIHITPKHLLDYRDARLKEGAAHSTIRNELNILKHGFTLALRARLVSVKPAFPTIRLPDSSIRRGFFEREDLDALLEELPVYVRPVVLFMYWSGWRRTEVLTRRWQHVDLAHGEIRLEPGETKNGKPRKFPFGKTVERGKEYCPLVPEVDTLLRAQQAYTAEVERKLGVEIPWVFHREGVPIKSFRTAWRLASRRAKLQVEAALQGVTTKALWRSMTKEEQRDFTGLQRIPHDFRRTAVRNLVRRGISQKVAMQITGHLTPSVFERYNITDDRDLHEAMARYGEVPAIPQTTA